MSAVAEDPLGQLLDLPGVREAVRSARDAVAEVHRHPTNRRGWPTTAAEASVRAARASAALDGGSVEIPADGAVSDPVLAGALRVAEAIGPLLTTWERAPLQALARMHVLAAADLVPEGRSEESTALGRPRPGEEIAARLNLLARVVTGSAGAPGPVVAAVVHGELLTLAPFGSGDGVVARSAARVVGIASGLDPKGLAVPEVAYLRRVEEYRAAAAAFATGTAEGVGEWIRYCCRAMEAGAREARSIADAAAQG
ncbi:Fic family protein [Streptoalloteichus hindustanus]|uniref:oxidoreductase n=1 Tax=Streptoalloteichus hindustanus TaxID=2017 RepID=UPI00190EC220|nr:oxidoreductase [Streptoalloteichus hindustanus]